MFANPFQEYLLDRHRSFNYFPVGSELNKLLVKVGKVEAMNVFFHNDWIGFIVKNMVAVVFEKSK